jgi:huckebein
MSAKCASPPQTYSRLFRPWDSKSETSDSEVEIKEEKRDTVSPVSPIRLPNADLDMSFSPRMDYPAELAYNYFYYQQKFAPEVISPIPFPAGVGMDMFSYEKIEQEYLRVLSEDAKAKVLSARKQRPKKFKCPHCDVAFSNNGQLKGHIRIHTGKSRLEPFQNGTKC